MNKVPYRLEAKKVRDGIRRFEAKLTSAQCYEDGGGGNPSVLKHKDEVTRRFPHVNEFLSIWLAREVPFDLFCTHQFAFNVKNSTSPYTTATFKAAEARGLPPPSYHCALTSLRPSSKSTWIALSTVSRQSAIATRMRSACSITEALHWREMCSETCQTVPARRRYESVRCSIYATNRPASLRTRSVAEWLANRRTSPHHGHSGIS